MTTASSIIQAAYREGNLIPAGSTPTTDEQTEALDRLNRLINGFYGYEMGENLADWLFPAPQRTAALAANFPQLPFPIDSSAEVLPVPLAQNPSVLEYPYPPINSRIVFGGVTGTLFFPERPFDGSRMALVQGSGAGDKGVAGSILTLDGNGRTIGGAPIQTYTDPVTATQWLYRSDLGDWVVVADMALTDNVPYPVDFDDLWITALSIRLASRYEKTVHEATAATFKTAMARFKARYRQSQSTVYGAQDFPRSLQGYISGNFWF